LRSWGTWPSPSFADGRLAKSRGDTQNLGNASAAHSANIVEVATKEDSRAAILLLLLALAGAVVRILGGGQGAPGAVGYRPTDAERPSQDSVAAVASRLARPLARDERIDLDRASIEDLTRLPRIGPALAARIVRDRETHGPFGSVEGLERVAGIGPTVLEALRPHVSVSGRPSPRSGSRNPPGKVSLNTAAANELAQLPGIGTVRARAIVEDRRRNGPYRVLDDLRRVQGIGPSTVERLRGRVSIP
jgi:competence ComEA-like helix-hairpin-helix protein